MSAWVLVPSLVSLRAEFNQLSPARDKGADGSIGDSAHTSSSDHTPDEDSDVLKDHDADSSNEVHALDIDSTGPWPVPFDALVKHVITLERRRWLDPGDVCRLEYVIWNRQIYSRVRDFNPVPYTLADPHTNHAHFSARYLTAAEDDTRPWGLLALVEDDMTTKAEFISWLKDDAVRQELAAAVLTRDGIIAAPGSPKPGTNADGTAVNTHWAASSYLYNNYAAVIEARDAVRAATATLKTVAGAVNAGNTADAARDADLRARLDATDSPQEIAQALAPFLPGVDAGAVFEAFRRAFGTASK